MRSRGMPAGDAPESESWRELILHRSRGTFSLLVPQARRHGGTEDMNGPS